MRVRWTSDPADEPGPDEALVRLWHTRVERGGGFVRFAGYRLSVRHPDGRELVAELPGSDSDRDAPLVASDAPVDLVELLNRAWRARQRPGRPKGYTTIEDAEQLRAPIREMRRVPMRTSQRNVEKRSGITRAMIRGFLARTGQTWEEFLASF